MSKTFHIGDQVRWNSEAGLVRGVIVRRLTSNTRWKGYIGMRPRPSPSTSSRAIKPTTSLSTKARRSATSRAVVS
jgi:hypothetical protein